jgi:TrmH family RNA methyltransferase
VAAAVASGIAIVDAFRAPGDERAAGLLGRRAVEVSPQVLARIADTEHPRGPIAVIEVPPPSLGDGDLVVLVGLGDPGNAGTIVRTAAAFGFGVVATPNTVDLWSPKVVRAGAGAHFQTPIAVLGPEWSDDCRRGGRRLAALVVEGGGGMDALRGTPVALLVGEEAAGIAEDVLAGVDVAVTIPMPGGTESLNAAVAVSIAMYERSRSR